MDTLGRILVVNSNKKNKTMKNNFLIVLVATLLTITTQNCFAQNKKELQALIEKSNVQLKTLDSLQKRVQSVTAFDSSEIIKLQKDSFQIAELKVLIDKKIQAHDSLNQLVIKNIESIEKTNQLLSKQFKKIDSVEKKIAPEIQVAKNYLYYVNQKLVSLSEKTKNLSTLIDQTKNKKLVEIEELEKVPCGGSSHSTGFRKMDFSDICNNENCCECHPKTIKVKKLVWQ